MSNNKQNKPTNAVNKTRAGEYKTKYIKSSTYLPSVFNTELNKKWLDSTLDQMLSKGDLQDISAYVGSRLGRHRNQDDSYLAEDVHVLGRTNTHMKPAVVTYDNDISNVISYDDISNIIKTTTDKYSYGSAYATEAFTFAPPINVDKFVNNSSYYWIPDMPIFRSENDSVDIAFIEQLQSYHWVDASGVEFDLENNMRIALPNVDGCVYMVAGVGHQIKLIKIIDENNKFVYDFETPGSPVSVVGLWDNADVSGDDDIDWDEAPWDAHTIVLDTYAKDYIVIDREDADNTAWSRNNNWIHRDTLVTWSKICNFNLRDYLIPERLAIRPIIEFEPGILKIADQEKIKMNQPPLFRIYSSEFDEWVDQLYGSFYKGSKIFGYKEGTGAIDSELGFSVVRQDTGNSADIVFENFLNTDKITTTKRDERDFIIESFELEKDIYFVQDGALKINYVPLRRPLYVKSDEQVIVTDSESDVIFNVGSDSWASTKELIIRPFDHCSWTTSELYADGAYVDCNEQSPSLILQAGETYDFHNLVPNARIVFFDEGTAPLYANGIEGTIFDFTMPVDEKTINYVVMTPAGIFGKIGKIHTHANIEAYRHDLSINGNKVDVTQYIVTNDTVVVPASLVSEGDIVDLEYFDRKNTTKASDAVPEIFLYNTKHETVSTLTISETLSHWTDQLSVPVGFTGKAFGYNNSRQLPRISNYGGNILLPKSMILPHAVSMSNDDFDISAAIMETGKDWWAFRLRMINQIRRLYKSSTFTTVRDFADAVIEKLIVSRKGTEVYKNSNMLYSTKDAISVEYKIDENSTNSFYLPHTNNNDENIIDHVYVYVTEIINSKSITRILIRNKDYRVRVNKVVLTSTFPIDTKVSIVYTPMDSESFVPPSLSKLYLDKNYWPQILGNSLICHDGDKITVANVTTQEELNSMLFDITSPLFDPVAAVIYDIETRVHAGIRPSKTANPEVLRPAQHRSTWFTNYDIENDMMYRHYSNWLNDTQHTPVVTEPDVNDVGGWTWNYSHIDVGGHIGNLPGYWKAAYYAIFDTYTPHITPWHMMGYPDQPHWWNDLYSWTVPSKRFALINALKHGIVGEHGEVDIRYARYYWDWDNQCPVDASGNLRAPIEVLVADTNARDFDINFAQSFKFEDWDEDQMSWRDSPVGRAALLSSLTMLSPVAAWKEFYTPAITSSLPRLIAGDEGMGVSAINVIYDNITGLPRSDEFVDTITHVEIFNGDAVRPARAELMYEDSRVSAISVTYRGLGYKTKPVVNVRSVDGNVAVDTDIQLKSIKFVSRGFDQVLYNYAIKNHKKHLYAAAVRTAETRLIQKLGGFSAKHLIKFYADSSKDGKFAMSDFDYDLIMYKGKPTELVTASSFNIKKLDSGYALSGLSPNKQQFYFYAPDATKANYIKDISLANGAATIKQYNRYSPEISIAEYGVKFKRIQDVYNFIRGNVKYLEDHGYILEKSRDELALQFAEWAMIAGVGASVVIRIGKKIEFSPEHGSCLEINSLTHQKNSVIDLTGRTISTENMTVTRSENSIFIEADYDIGSATVAVVDFEHSVLFKNTTDFGRVIFDDVLQRKQDRFKLECQRTKDWHGRKQAPGFLVLSDKIIQNWDSAVDDIRDYYDVNITKFNDSAEKLESLTNGNISRDWINEFGLSQNTINEYYKGVIRDKGTNSVIDQINNTSLLNFGNSTFDHNEVWMFRDGMFGDVTNFNAVEFMLRHGEMKDQQQLLKFVDEPTHVGIEIVSNSTLPGGQKRYVNGTKPTFRVVPFKDRNLQLRTAGDLLKEESDFTTMRFSDIPSMYDKLDGTDIETWNPLISYKFGERVRLDGKLYECAVQSTGLNLTGTNASITSSVRFPTIPFGTIGIFRTSEDADYTEVEFGKKTSALENISVIGSVSEPVVTSANDVEIVIDGKSVSLVNQEQVLQDSEFPLTSPGASNVFIEDTFVERFLTINGIQVDLAESNTPTIPGETYTGDGETFTFSISQNLGTFVSNTIFDVYVASVKVDGVTQTEGSDYTISEANNTITFNTAPGIASFVETIIIPEEIINEGTPEEEIIPEHTVEQIVPAVEATITISFAVSNSKGFSEIKDRIESSVPNVFVFEDNDTKKFFIRGTVPGTNESVVIGTGSANNALGLVEGEYFGGSSLVLVHTELSLDDVIIRINDADIVGILATRTNDKLVIISQNNSLNIQGTASVLEDLGIIAGTRTATVVEIEAASDINDIVEKLNEAFGASDIQAVAAQVAGSLFISSDTSYIEIGSTEVINNLGFAATGTNEFDQEIFAIRSQDEQVKNTFIETDWNDISYKDPTLVSIWVTDDSAYPYQALAGRQIRFNSWNVYKIMNFGYFSSDDDGCSICAGNATRDGNDAQVTLNEPHNLQVGDYVVIHNSTTVPSVDGIHQVTRIDTTNSRTFYIDMYIDECGTSPCIQVIRNMRFAEDFSAFDNQIDILNYRFAVTDLVYVTPMEDDKQVGTFVYGMVPPEGLNDIVTHVQSYAKRKTTTRVTNDDILNISIYDGRKTDASFELEVYDPLRGIIPGVADREINFKSPIDLAAYTHSSDITFEGENSSAWGEAEVGKVWWDTSTVSYFDYTQGSVDYRAKKWALQFPGSSIDIYEWIKSDVPPDEWYKSVDANKYVIDKVATGTAYTVFDASLNEDVFFYTEDTEWNKEVSRYEKVYYFWVKNKITLEDSNRRLTAKQIADIINNPTSAGISWCAAVDANNIVISNVRPYLNNASTVMQINRILDNTAHTSWTEITEHVDVIPEFWYEYMRDNLVGYKSKIVSYDEAPEWQPEQSYVISDVVSYNGVNYNCAKVPSTDDSFDIQMLKGCWVEEDTFVLTDRLPDPILHEYNRFGADYDLNQGWFKDLFAARREFITNANRNLRTINMVDSLPISWYGKLSKFDDLWEWIDYVSPARVEEQTPSIVVSRPSELDDVDTTKHTLVLVRDYYDVLDLNRDEIHQWNGVEWNLVEKKNSTIQINDLLWNKAAKNTWDMSPWDSGAWDFDYNEGMFVIVETLREYVFVKQNEFMFNEAWFSTIDYAISSSDNVDWAYKTTYIKTYIETPVESDVKKYTRDNTNEIINYINTVKPFHTKIRDVFDSRTVNDSISLNVEDTSQLDIEMRFDVEDLTIAFNGDIMDGGDFSTVSNETQASDWSYDSEAQGGQFIQPGLYNWTGDRARRLVFNAEIEDSATIEVTTDNSGTLTKFLYVIDPMGRISTYTLLLDETENLTADVSEGEQTMLVSNVTGHETSGLAYIGGEIVEYRSVGNNSIIDITRGTHGTRAKTHNTNDELIFLKNE